MGGAEAPPFQTRGEKCGLDGEAQPPAPGLVFFDTNPWVVGKDSGG
jgi:hypothetical protein